MVFVVRQKAALARGLPVLAFLVAAIAASVLPHSASANNCLYLNRATGTLPSYACLVPMERALVDLRKFRAQINVAALRCDQQQLYNQFVLRHQDELVTHGKGLVKVFRRLFGPSAPHELNRFVTYLANRASIDSMGDRNYCQSMSRVVAQAIMAPRHGLTAFISDNPLARAVARDKMPTRMPVTSVATVRNVVKTNSK